MRLNEQLRRNLQRFPEDFAFQLTAEEWVALRSQIATLKTGRGGHRKYAPYAFTEHGTLIAYTPCTIVMWARMFQTGMPLADLLKPLMSLPGAG